MQPNDDSVASGRRVRLIALVCALIIVAGTAGAVALTRPSDPPPPHAVPVTSPSLTPYEQAVDALIDQAGALIDGDETAWLAPVAPALVPRYRGIYTSLRTLGVTRFEYTPDAHQPVQGEPETMSFQLYTWYCFGPDTCQGDGDPPGLLQKVTMKPSGGRYRLTEVADPTLAVPTPWQDGTLTFKQGARVTLAAPPGETDHLAAVLPVAEQAAAVSDRFAKILTTPQTRYRVYLAGEKEWRKWYGGDDNKWVVGLARSINKTGVDVLVRIDAIQDQEELRTVLQHELGHVVTLTGANDGETDRSWLAEGVAEYIGWSPRPATAGPRRDSARRALARHGLKSMIPARPRFSASLSDGDAYYGLSHFAVDCLAREYGQEKMFGFVRQVLTWNEAYDGAARYVLGVPFATVDKTCRAWIRRTV